MNPLIKITVIGLLCFLTGCGGGSDNNVISGESNTTSAVSGSISYNGLYTGTNTTIYIRAYTTETRAIGNPDYTTAITNGGTYNLDLGSYTGDLYLSAFMDVDNSGSVSGPSASGILNEGVFADPSGCYGDYTFNAGGPLLITVDGLETGIDFELIDSGVIKFIFSETGDNTTGVIGSNILSDEFLHHSHFNVTATSENFYLAVPPRSNWYCKVKFDNNPTAQLYSVPVDVQENSVVDVIF